MCMSALRHQLFNHVHTLTTQLYCVACKTGYKKCYKQASNQGHILTVWKHPQKIYQTGLSQEPKISVCRQPFFLFTNQVGHGNPKMVSVTDTDLMLIGTLKSVT